MTIEFSTVVVSMLVLGLSVTLVCFYDSSLKMEKSRTVFLAQLKHFTLAIDNASIVSIMDSNGIMTDVNDAFCKISKNTRDERIGQTHRLVNSGHRTHRFLKELWQTATQGRVWKGEIRKRYSIAGISLHASSGVSAIIQGETNFTVLLPHHIPLSLSFLSTVSKP